MIKPLFDRMVAALNGSEQSLRAAMYGIMMSKLYGCELKVVYVVDTATLKQLELLKFFIAEESSRYERNLVADGERYLSYVADLARQKGVALSSELRRGAVWSELIRAANEFGARLILVGDKNVSDGTSPVGGVLRYHRISATNSEIVGSSECNVLVVKEREVEKLFRLA